MAPSFRAESFFVFAAADGEGAEAHLAGVLDPEVAESSDALDGHQITGGGSRIAQRVENRDAGAKQRRGVGGRKFIGNGGYRFGGREHVFLIAAVVTDAGDLFVLAVDEIASAAGIASEIMSAVPSYADALAGLPVFNVGADGVNATGNFVSRNAWDIGFRANGLLSRAASLWQMPQASTLILTWLRAGSGIFLSTSSKLPPGLLTWTAFILGMALSS